MAKFVSQIAAATPAQMIALAAGVNAALRGDSANVGTFTLAAGSTSVTLTDSRCRHGRLALLVPRNAAAAALHWYVSAMENGTMTFSFTSTPSSAAEFGWAIIGDGGE